MIIALCRCSIALILFVFVLPLTSHAAVFLLPTSGDYTFGTTFTFDFESRRETGFNGALAELRLFEGDLGLTITRSDPFDIVNISNFANQPSEFGQRSLSPFAFERSPTPFSMEFSKPVRSVRIEVGDFGADTPDIVQLRGFEREVGTLFEVDNDTTRVTTNPPNNNDFNSSSVGIRSADGIDTAIVIGGTETFPNSVYYDNITVTRPPLFRLATDVAKREELTQLAAEEGGIFLLTKALVVGGCVAITEGGCLAVLTAVEGLSTIGHAATFSNISRIVADPPRPDFQEIFEARDISLPGPDYPDGTPDFFIEASTTAIDSSAQVYAYTEAWLVTLERYQGAVLAGDEASAQLQLQALERIIVETSVAADASRKASILLADAAERIVTFSGEANTAVDGIRDEFVSDGFSAYQISVLQALGANDVEIQNLANIAVQGANAGEASNPFRTISQDYETLANNTQCASNSCVIQSGVIDPNGKPFIFSFEVTELTVGASVDLILGDLLYEGVAQGFDVIDSIIVSLLIDNLEIINSSILPFHFVLRNQEDYGAIVSKIRLQPVPLPNSLALLISVLFVSTVVGHLANSHRIQNQHTRAV